MFLCGRLIPLTQFFISVAQGYLKAETRENMPYMLSKWIKCLLKSPADRLINENTYQCGLSLTSNSKKECIFIISNTFVYLCLYVYQYGIHVLSTPDVRQEIL